MDVRTEKAACLWIETRGRWCGKKFVSEKEGYSPSKEGSFWRLAGSSPKEFAEEKAAEKKKEKKRKFFVYCLLGF